MGIMIDVVDGALPTGNETVPPPVANKIYKFKDRKKTIENGLKMLRTLTEDVAVGISELRATLDIIIYGLPDKVNQDQTESRRRFIEAYNYAYKGKRGETWLKIANAIMCLISEFPIERTLARDVVRKIGYLISPRPFKTQNEYWYIQLSTKFSVSKFTKDVNTLH